MPSPSSVLTDTLKSDIQAAYSRLLESRGFRARQCQKLMIAAIARTLGQIEVNEDGEREQGPNTCVVEAGTGTGKTIAYTLACLPIARALGKKLVISTATVALQEQITYLDLPDIRKHANLDLTFALAKGRRRYLCLSRLDQVLQSDPATDSLTLFDDAPTGDMDLKLYQEMLEKLGRGEWNGDRDDWPEEISYGNWAPVSTDHIRCTGRQCTHFENCVFYRAREQIHRVDCIVTNHDLVLADLMMGGGAVLPAPEDAIYVFDEGHHLPDKAASHFASFLQIRSTKQWVLQIPTTLQLADADLRGLLPEQTRQSLEHYVSEIARSLDELLLLTESFEEAASHERDRATYRFAMGLVPDEIGESARDLVPQFTGCESILSQVVKAVDAAMEAADSGEREVVERWLPVISGMEARLSASAQLFRRLRDPDPEGQAPHARWMVFVPEDMTTEVQLHVSPISVNETLQDLLWSRSFGVVVTSATLSFAGDFTRYRERSGIGEDNTFLTLPSPFDFPRQGQLQIPSMGVDPGDPDGHTEAIAELLPQLLIKDRATLVLFTSWRQMLGVTNRIEEEFAQCVLRQGDLSRSEIVRVHKARIDGGETSCIFGLASFAEGIDLPGSYCDHVVICKIPFAVPDDPLGATLSEWIEQRGGNSFEEVMIPDAALRMVQACGRLLRTETDTGTVTILDKRLLEKRYGQRLLQALPPFKRVFGEVVAT